MIKTIDRYIREPADSFFLFGPRGTGKSTWLQQRFPEALWVNLLMPDIHRRLAAHPERLVEILDAHEQKTVVIDEVQKVPELLTVVHEYLERKEGWRFILTGSSSRKLKRSGVDLLAGRAAVSFAHPFMACELGEAFRLERALQLGTIPLVMAGAEPAETLAGYVMLYVREEIMAEGLVRDIGGFSRFLEAISFSHASLLNITEVSRECEVSRKTVEGYVSVVEDMLLGSRLPIFSKRAKRAVIKQSKFYLSDSGVFRSLRPTGPLDRLEELDGAALEGLVHQHLRAWIDYAQNRCKLFFWRTPSGTEVDFVIYGDTQFVAVEVKNAARISKRDLKALKAFCGDYPACTPLLLYRGRERLVIDDILCMPVDDFLRGLTPDRSIIQ